MQSSTGQDSSPGRQVGRNHPRRNAGTELRQCCEEQMLVGLVVVAKAKAAILSQPQQSTFS